MPYYHVEPEYVHNMKDLPDRILVREDGYLGAYKYDDEPIIDYWYVRERICKITMLGTSSRTFECSECGRVSDYDSFGPFEYCPHCGCKIIEIRR